MYAKYCRPCRTQFANSAELGVSATNAWRAGYKISFPMRRRIVKQVSSSHSEHLGLHPKLTEADIQGLSDKTHVFEHMRRGSEPSILSHVSLPDDLVLTDVSRALVAWTELMGVQKETPLFPIQSLADILQLLVPLWSKQPEWRESVDLVDEIVGDCSGKSALAQSRTGPGNEITSGWTSPIDALEEFHQAKIDWWSGETVRGSLLAMITIARLYLEYSGVRRSMLG